MNKHALHAKLSGHTTWAVLDAQGRTVSTGEHHNLITNAGLDAFGTSSSGFLWNGGRQAFEIIYFGHWRRFLHLGTGSAEPTATGTAIDGEVSVSDTAGGFNAEINAGISSTADSWTLTSRHVRAQSFTQARNLTNYGFSPQGAGSAVSIWEKFRQPGGAPLVVTVQPGQVLKVSHDLTITLPRGIAPEVTRAVTGLGNLSGRAGFWTNTGQGRLEWFTALFAPVSDVGAMAQVLTAADTFDPTAAPTVGGSQAFVTVGGYTSGTYTRRKSYVFAASESNGPVYGINTYTGSINGAAGYRLGLTSGAINKDDTKRLTFDFDVTWGRA